MQSMHKNVKSTPFIIKNKEGFLKCVSLYQQFNVFEMLLMLFQNG